MDDVGAEHTLLGSRGPGRSQPSGESGTLLQGTTLGRYVVLETLGRGGMGVVYGAYDPSLDRRVAVKLVHRDVAGSEADSRSRLLREAQALARLTHPNVVVVHDAGTVDGRVFIAMEYVDGRTLKEWMAERRSWRDVLEVYVLAGRGLAAAHDAGLVHRDFKPDNVMVGRDGRVRVMDFGLARPVEQAVGLLDSSAGALVAEVDRGAGLTRPGALLGTPAYMALEQLLGQGADARSDQFSFCVALYEALYGTMPFGGSTVAARAGAIARDEVHAPPRRSSVPAWLRAAVVKGLAADPTARHGSMNALLDALRGDPARRRARRFVVGAVVAGLGAVAMVAPGLQRAPRCSGAAAQVSEVWNDARRDDVRKGLLDTGRPYAEVAWSTVGPELDAYAMNWARTHTAVCEANRGGEQSDAALDTQMACLRGRLRQFDALVGELGQADDRLLERASEAVADLESISRCRERSATAFARPTDPSMLAQLDVAEEALARATAKETAGRYAAGLAAIEAALAAIEHVDYPPVEAQVRVRLASLQHRTGDVDAAVATMGAAIAVASRADDRQLAAEAWLRLMHLEAQENKQPDAALDLKLPAEVAVARAGGNDDLRGRLAANVGAAHHVAGRFDQAREQLEQSLELAVGDLDAQASRHNQLALLLVDLGEHEAAKTHQLESLRLTRKLRGEGHPSVATDLSNLGRLEDHEGDYDQAEDYYRQALKVREDALGQGHPGVGEVLVNLGALNYKRRRFAEARRLIEQALGIWADTRDPDHPHVGIAHVMLGNVESGQEHHEAAIDHYRAAAEIYVSRFGPDHPRVAVPVNNIALVEHGRGRYAEAEAGFLRALAIEEKALGPDHPDLAYQLTGLGKVYIDRGQPGRAVEPLTRALELREGAVVDPGARAHTYFDLARALWSSGRDRTRAAELAAKAHRAWIETGNLDSPLLGDMEKWFRARGLAPPPRVPTDSG